MIDVLSLAVAPQTGAPAAQGPAGGALAAATIRQARLRRLSSVIKLLTHARLWKRDALGGALRMYCDGFTRGVGRRSDGRRGR